MVYKAYVKYFFPDAYLQTISKPFDGYTTIHHYRIVIKDRWDNKFIILSRGKSPSSTWRSAKICMTPEFIWTHTPTRDKYDNLEEILYANNLFSYIYEQ